MNWTPALRKRLSELWYLGYSTKTMGDMLGVSKNAIVGQVHRLGLDPRPSPIRRDPLYIAPPRPAPLPPAAKTLPPLPSVAKVVPSKPVPIVGKTTPTETPAPITEPTPAFKPRSPRACCFPFGDPGTKEFRFCEETSVPGRSYCEAHCRIVYVRPNPNREVSA